MLKKNLPLEKLMCPICRGILIEPVTMPCSHILCLSCFNGSMEMANLSCPLCRKRVGGWLRTVKKQGKLVDKQLWDYIQEDFADYVTAKQLGEDDAIEDVLEGTAPPPLQLSMPGEIRKEFENCQASLERELKVKQEAELKASEDLIKKLQDEEKERQEREQEDERLARELQAKLEQEVAEESMMTDTADSESPLTENVNASQRVENKENKLGTSTPVRGPLDAFLKPLHSSRNTPQTERLKRESLESRCDSITPEILHFKPITTVPLTPPKTLPDGRVLEVPVIRATPVKNLLQLDSAGNSPILAKQLATLQVERKYGSPRKFPRLELDNSTSAFRGFQYSANIISFGGIPQKKPPSSTITSQQQSEEAQRESNMETQCVEVQSNNNNNIVKTERIPQNFSPDMFGSDEDETLHKEEAPSTRNVDHGLTEQERQDFLFAQQLQKSFDLEVNNADNDKYQLRKRPSKGISKRKSSVQRNRSISNSSVTQPTLREVFRRAANKNSQ